MHIRTALLPGDGVRSLDPVLLVYLLVGQPVFIRVDSIEKGGEKEKI